MGKYIKLFDTTTQYNAYTADTSNFILPNVSVAKDAPTTVYYNPYVAPPTPSHDYVEIGGIKWATMNIGANSVTDYGLYFAWGDTQGYTSSQVGSGAGEKYFDWGDYKYGGDNEGGQTKYNETDGKAVLDAEDDAVTAAWGGNWRMPTTEEFQALGTATTSAWTADYEGSGVAGLVLTSNEDSSKKLFFPAAGFCGSGSVDYVGNTGNYWSSSLSSYEEDAYELFFDSDYSSVDWVSNSGRCYGVSVRGILDE